jgi:hypothetical protein
MQEFFGLASGVLPIIGAVPYIRDILRRKTKPHRSSFLIWAVLNSIAVSALFAKGATWSLVMPTVGVLEVLTTFILSLRYGVGGFSKKDYAALSLAGLGLILWHFTKQPLIALGIVIAVDAIGMALTITKTYQHPHTETFSTWFLSFIAAICAMLAVSRWEPSLLVYPLCIALGNGMVCITILLRRSKLKPATVSSSSELLSF